MPRIIKNRHLRRFTIICQLFQTPSYQLPVFVHGASMGCSTTSLSLSPELFILRCASNLGAAEYRSPRERHCSRQASDQSVCSCASSGKSYRVTGLQLGANHILRVMVPSANLWYFLGGSLTRRKPTVSLTLPLLIRSQLFSRFDPRYLRLITETVVVL